MMTRWISGLSGLSLGLVLGTSAVLAWAQEPKPAAPPAPAPAANPEAVQFFENKIRPILVQHCNACHGPNAQRGSLRLDTKAAFFKGGDSGAVVVPGDVEKSLLLHVVRYDGPVKMPPAGKLKPAQIEELTTWVRMGAPWGFEEKGAPGPEKAHAAPDPKKPFWAFQPVKSPVIPATRNKTWRRNPVDAFVLAKLERKGLQPSPPATKRELIRRAYYGLVGLPPSPEEVERFIADPDPKAYEKLLDRLLAMPQYGERWGRHWLDVVRFAQTNGYERDDEKPEAWRYRDYVIQSFNEDKPYDQFIREQLAGDELEPPNDASLTATAFYRLGVWDDEPDDARQAEFDNLDDMLSTASTAFMGLTVGCARCHDHKFDPISQQEYYGLLAFLRNVRRYANPDPKKPEDTAIFAALSNGEKTLAVREHGPTPPKTQVLIRGNAATPGPEVAPRFIQVLSASPAAVQPQLPTMPPNAATSGRRKVLADWIASPRHPLTARVMVNRLWQHHFGRGIVETANDFGRTGTAPTHPELLDYLASELVKGGWKLKRLHKLIMLSAAYQQSSRVGNPKAAAADPANTLLWRQNLRRLEAEAIRDSILAATGKLNLKMGGRGIFPVLPPEVLSTQSVPGRGWGQSDEAERNRRSVYIFVKRTLGVPLLETFDFASPDSSVAQRATTTIAPQALILLNSAFMDEQSVAFAQRLLKEAGPDRAALVERAFQLTVARKPTEREARVAAEYLERQRQACSGMPAEAGELTAVSRLGKVMLNLNEFVYVD